MKLLKKPETEKVEKAFMAIVGICGRELNYTESDNAELASSGVRLFKIHCDMRYISKNQMLAMLDVILKSTCGKVLKDIAKKTISEVIEYGRD